MAVLVDYESFLSERPPVGAEAPTHMRIDMSPFWTMWHWASHRHSREPVVSETKFLVPGACIDFRPAPIRCKIPLRLQS
jgi:hypothetical protein